MKHFRKKIDLYNPSSENYDMAIIEEPTEEEVSADRLAVLAELEGNNEVVNKLFETARGRVELTSNLSELMT